MMFCHNSLAIVSDSHKILQFAMVKCQIHSPMNMQIAECDIELDSKFYVTQNPYYFQIFEPTVTQEKDIL